MLGKIKISYNLIFTSSKSTAPNCVLLVIKKKSKKNQDVPFLSSQTRSFRAPSVNDLIFDFQFQECNKFVC